MSEQMIELGGPLRMGGSTKSEAISEETVPVFAEPLVLAFGEAFAPEVAPPGLCVPVVGVAPEPGSERLVLASASLPTVPSFASRTGHRSNSETTSLPRLTRFVRPRRPSSTFVTWARLARGTTPPSVCCRNASALTPIARPWPSKPVLTPASEAWLWTKKDARSSDPGLAGSPAFMQPEVRRARAFTEQGFFPEIWCLMR